MPEACVVFPAAGSFERTGFVLYRRNACFRRLLDSFQYPRSITKGWSKCFDREWANPNTEDVLRTIEGCKGNIIFDPTVTCWKGLSMCLITTLRGFPAGYLEEAIAHAVFRARAACSIKMHARSLKARVVVNALSLKEH
ncbi:hypothetical protein Pyn_33742 [Prunus yedoensis var. nudiflora]|uniref:Uncharacterized protein n=1 Tax=Prunus yedoensis var. nudiflora TaxID=2094558 RepID=A0A314XL87_PRUYE|nr:hypothetical protein Pyn_33742 [Prunus yedoensis var. nudiflora]